MGYDWMFDATRQKWMPSGYTSDTLTVSASTGAVKISLPNLPQDPPEFKRTNPKEGHMAANTVKLSVKFTNGDVEDFAATKHYASDGLVTLQNAKSETVATLNQDQVRSITPVSELEAPEVTVGKHTYAVHTLKGVDTVAADTYRTENHSSEGDAVFYTFTTTLPSGYARTEGTFPAQQVVKIVRVDAPADAPVNGHKAAARV